MESRLTQETVSVQVETVRLGKIGRGNREKEKAKPMGEGNSGSDGKGEWTEMVQACVKEG